ncbi:MAG: ABC transporter ATP-binding protein [Candidatus Thorarchaeota archaeon]|nr:ABC transporter ATP-binding protein [Candidatus Thorarchaeota archaeon]
MNEITIFGLTKNFGELVAVDHMDLNIPGGTIFGLLGPNGAGKSTTTRLLSTLLQPTDGTARVSEFDIIQEPVRVREITGVLPEESNRTVYPGMTAYENLEYFARLYDVPEEEIPARIEELLTFMDLWDRKDDKAGELSTGNRQRVALCRAILHRPTVLLLDEPTSSLDPLAAKRVRELILELSKKYKQTFLINSHNLPEVQRVCNRIAIIDEGKVLLQGKTQELRSQLLSKQKFRIRIVGDIEKASSIAKSMNFVEAVKEEVDSILVTIEDPTENNSSLMQNMLSQGIKIVEFAEEEATLEDLYLEVVKGGIQK